MVGFYTGQLGSVALEEQGSDAVAAPAADVLSAVAGSAFAANPTPRLLRAPLGGGLDAETQSYWRNYRDPAGRNQDSDVAAMEAERGPPPAVLTPEEANKQYGIKGVLSFDKPVPEPVAADLHSAKHAEIVRQDTIARRTPGIATGGFARTAVSLAMGLLDPLNIAAGLVPGFGEARIASALGMDLAGSLASRIGARALAGASGGAFGMAALEPLNYALDQHEHNDWSAGEALRNIAFGAGIGSVLHVGIGAIVDRLAPQIRAAGPETQAMALRGAVSHIVDGRIVDVAPALDMAEPRPPEVRAEANEELPIGGTMNRPAPKQTPLYPKLPKEPTRLATFIRQLGGMQDQGGEVAHILGGERRPGLVNVGGLPPDEVALRAWEQGYFPELGEARPSTNDLLNALEDDLKGYAPRYSDNDIDAVAAFQDAVARNDEVSRLASNHDIDTTGLTREQFFERLSEQASLNRAYDLSSEIVDARFSEQEIRDRAAQPPYHPSDVADARANEDTIGRAPVIEGAPDAELVAAQKAADDSVAMMQTEIDAGRLSEDSLGELKATEELIANAERDAKAYEAAAACLASRIA